MDTRKLKALIRNAEIAENKFNTQCAIAAIEICNYMDFETEEEDFFGIDFQPSDGIVLTDHFSKVYDLTGILKHIKEKGKFKSYEDLGYYSI